MKISLLPCHLLLSCSLFAISQTASAQDFSEFDHHDYYHLISEYVLKIENIYDGNWAFTYTVDDKLEQETRTIRRDTSLPFLESEKLIAINGQPPSEERLEEHAERRQRALRRRQNNQNRPVQDEEEGNEQERFLEMLIPESIHLIRQDGALLYLGFRAVEEGREKIYANLRGLLILDTDAAYVRELQVRVTEPFSPFLLSRIEEGYFSLRFKLDEGVPVQSEISFGLKGQAFFVRDLDENREVVWTDLERIQNNSI